VDKDVKEKEKQVGAGLGGLAGYGDSEDEDEGNEADETTIPLNKEQKTDNEADDPVKEARRARAREWAEKRRHNSG